MNPSAHMDIDVWVDQRRRYKIKITIIAIKLSDGYCWRKDDASQDLDRRLLIPSCWDKEGQCSDLIDTLQLTHTSASQAGNTCRQIKYRNIYFNTQ